LIEKTNLKSKKQKESEKRGRGFSKPVPDLNSMQRAFSVGVSLLSRARALGFSLQYIGLNGLLSFVPGAKAVQRDQNPQLLKQLLEEIRKVLRSDADLFAQGVLPLSCLWGTSVLPSRSQFLDGLIDGWKVYRRRGDKAHNDLPEEIDLARFPLYYRRNFHYQSDGYFSYQSALRYDRQVDLLFSGTTDAMRRAWIPDLLKLPLWKDRVLTGGAGLKLMDLACGPASGTVSLAQLFPEAEITIQDLSKPYLQRAQERLAFHRNLKVIEGNAEKLALPKASIDLCLCVYLFHELPMQAREAVFAEVARVLKPGGMFIIVDSLQVGDSKIFDPLLSNFPQNFHEPFYMNYIKKPLRKIAATAGLSVLSDSTAFASKYMILQKPTPAKKKDVR